MYDTVISVACACVTGDSDYEWGVCASETSGECVRWVCI